MTSIHQFAEPPSKAEQALARTGYQLMPPVLGPEPLELSITVTHDGHTEAVQIPPTAYEILRAAMEYLANGEAVTLLPLTSEVTTQQAADLLHVSRPFLVGLVESGQIPFRKVGTKRRIQLQDVLTYKDRIDAQRLATLDELAAQAQELNMGYEE